MIITDFNNMTVEELEVLNLTCGVTLVISDGKIVEAKGEISAKKNNR